LLYMLLSLSKVKSNDIASWHFYNKTNSSFGFRLALYLIVLTNVIRMNHRVRRMKRGAFIRIYKGWRKWIKLLPGQPQFSSDFEVAM